MLGWPRPGGGGAAGGPMGGGGGPGGGGGGGAAGGGGGVGGGGPTALVGLVGVDNRPPAENKNVFGYLMRQNITNLCCSLNLTTVSVTKNRLQSDATYRLVVFPIH